MKSLVCLAGLTATLYLALPMAAATLGQVQKFDGPVSGWVIGAGPVIGTPTDVPLVASGGPGGVGDAYMLIESTGGSGPGSRLTAQNFSFWAGDYTSAGIGAITMDVRNFGSTDVFLRLLLLDFVDMNPANGAFSSAAVQVAAGADWHTITFPVTVGALTNLLGSTATAVANVDELRIFHNPDPFFIPTQNPPLVASVGVDNISAVPEPGSWALLVGGLILLRAACSSGAGKTH